MVRPLGNRDDLNCCFSAHSGDEAEDQKYLCGLSKVPVLVNAGPGVHLSWLLNTDAVQVYSLVH